MSHTLAFIDSRVADYQTLIAGLGTDTEWVLIDAYKDGIDQMRSALAGYSGLDSIQIVSHGSSGSVLLGSTVLDASSLGGYESQLKAIGASLSETGDLLLYGCNVGQGAVGAQFIDALALATGADVAASVNITGAGGDWVLETATESIEAAVLAPVGYGATLGWIPGTSAAETLLGSGGADTINGFGGNDSLDGQSGNDSIDGGEGDDTLVGGLGNDSLSGGNSGDHLIGGAGADTLDGGQGPNTLPGGDGSDTYEVNDVRDVVSETNATASSGGTDLVNASVSYTLGANVENLTPTGSAAINGTGNALANVITGNTGANTLGGGDGADTLTGGLGADRLTGGTGADTFRFVTTGDGSDTITDFVSGTDKIYIVAANFGLTVGAGASLVINGTPSSAAAAFVYNSTTGVLGFDSDGNGLAVATQLATLSNKPAGFKSADFVIGA